MSHRRSAAPVERAPPPSPKGDTAGGPPSPPAAALVLVGALALVAWMGPTRALVGVALLPWTVAFVALLLLWHRHRPWLAQPGVLLGGALLLRILFLLSSQDLSDDLVRYTWDGWLGVQGIPPYRFRPDDPALAHLQGDGLFPRLNSPAYHSIYPPLSQLVFLVGGWVHEVAGWPLSGRAIRLGFTLLEMAGVVALHRALRDTSRSPADLALYAWNPLVLLAVAGSGHSEGGLVLGVGLLLAGVALRRPGVAWSGWVLAVLAKGVPLLLAPLVWRTLARTSGGRATLRGLLPALVLGAGLCAPFLRLDDLPRVWSSAQLYVHLFEFNAGLHALLSSAGWSAAPTLRWVAVAGALWIGMRHRADSVRALARGSLLVLSLYLVTATTVHPWYLLWVLPFLPFNRTGLGPWLWASWAGLATYLFYAGVPGGPLALLFWGGMLGWWVHDERERFFRPLRRWAGRRKAGWIAPWVAGTEVLDVGGAEGHLARALRRARPCRVTVLAWQAPAGYGSGEPLGWIRGDARALPLPDGSADTVLLSFVLHHVGGDGGAEEALAEALRVARQRVVILESTFRGPVEGRALACLDAWVNRGREPEGEEAAPHAAHPVAHRTAERWIALATALGARVVVADRPRGSVHRVLRLVLEPPGVSPGDQKGTPKFPNSSARSPSGDG
jgi:alpha-1,6-mannosyltransferase